MTEGDYEGWRDAWVGNDLNLMARWSRHIGIGWGLLTGDADYWWDRSHDTSKLMAEGILRLANNMYEQAVEEGVLSAAGAYSDAKNYTDSEIDLVQQVVDDLAGWVIALRAFTGYSTHWHIDNFAEYVTVFQKKHEEWMLDNRIRIQDLEAIPALDIQPLLYWHEIHDAWIEDFQQYQLSWIKGIQRELGQVFWHLIHNPSRLIRGWIVEAYDWMALFFKDPKAYILGIVADSFEWVLTTAIEAYW